MQEQINEKLSQFIDDELDSRQALSLLESVLGDEVLKEKLRRYQIASQLMKSNEYSPVSSGFADRIHQRLRQEPIYFIPRKKATGHWSKAALAIAASIALAVVWVSSKVDQQNNSPFASVETVASNTVQAGAMNARFKEYLQAHDNALYVNNMQVAQPDARVVGYQQE